ncbi:MAG TPA: DUF3570 domain-containing protein [Tepidisphaeraceae bacterium]|jgi:hypothetical protein|nr:DUF3570 domain-containing protein [Tepidisphaeraceae bacterium]
MPTISNRWMVGLSVPILAGAQARGEDQFGFVHEAYVEDHGRMSVNSDALRVQLTLSPWLDVTASGVYDAISGATPTGAPAIDQLTLRRPGTHTPVPPSTITGFTRLIDGVSGASPGSAPVARSAIPLAESHDIRRGGDIALGMTFGPHRLTPSISYSQENDYVSWGGALNYSLDLNDKNTILNAGWAHAYDRILPTDFAYLTGRQIKNTDDFILGVTQLLGPKTVVSASGTIEHAEGYLNDPYRSVVFDESPLNANAQVPLAGEKRPSTRDSQALFLSATQAVTPLNASVEGTYRFYHDSYGITANTVGVGWFQKIGRTAVVSPSFRYYRQGAANFYGIQFPGDPDFDPARVPRYYSSDYRLSAFQTFTLGLEGTIHLSDRFDLRLGYQRYWMRGLDHQTLQSAYPGASIFTIGLNYTF